MGVRISREVMGNCKMDLFPSLEMPPAASTMKASGAHSKRRRNFAGAEGLTGLMKSPPPCKAVIDCISSNKKLKQIHENKGVLELSGTFWAAGLHH